MNSENLSRAINEVGRRRKISSWRGYTLEELRTQRVVTQARILIERNRLELAYSNVRERRARDKSVIRRVLGALTAVDYAVMGIGVAKRLMSIISHFKANHKAEE